MKKFRVAVIGCGAVSKNHGKALSQNPNTELSYAVDIDIEKAKAFSSTYGGEVLTDYRDLYDKSIDCAHIVTPHMTHPQIAIDLMNHGINVFCEKPLAINSFDALRMIETSEKTGMKLGVCFQNRVNDSTILAKSIIDSKEYGEIVSAMILVAWDRQGDYYSKSPWRGKYEGEGAGCIINQAIHTIDLLDYLCGGVKVVNGFTARLRNTNDYEVEDTSMARFILKNGAQAVGFMTNSYPMSKICQLEVHFEKATMLLDQTRVFIKTSDGQEKDHRFEAAQGYKSEWGLSHGKLIGLFYDSLETGKPFICDAKTGVQTIRIVNALQHSNGHEITIA